MEGAQKKSLFPYRGSPSKGGTKRIHSGVYLKVLYLVRARLGDGLREWSQRQGRQGRAEVGEWNRKLVWLPLLALCRKGAEEEQTGNQDAQ